LNFRPLPAFAEAERAERWKGTYARENPAEY
jgi:hypothetical protein